MLYKTWYQQLNQVPAAAANPLPPVIILNNNAAANPTVVDYKQNLRINCCADQEVLNAVMFPFGGFHV